MSSTFCPFPRGIGSMVQISIFAVCAVSVGADCAGIGIAEMHREAMLAAAVQFNHFMAATNKAPQGDHLAAYMTNPFLTMNKVCFNLKIN